MGQVSRIATQRARSCEKLEARLQLAVGPQPIADVPYADEGSSPSDIRWYGDTAFFDTSNGQVWSSDGVHGAEYRGQASAIREYFKGRFYSSIGGTLTVSDEYDGPPEFFKVLSTSNVFHVQEIKAGDEYMYIVTRESQITLVPLYRLWRSDGTSEGTTELASFSLRPSLREFIDNDLYFVTYSRVSNKISASLNVATATSLQNLETISPSGPSIPIGTTSSDFYEVKKIGTNVYFTSSKSGLWLVQPRQPPFFNSRPAIQVTTGSVRELTVVGSSLYFRKTDENGAELWKAAGSSASMVKDIYPGIRSSEPNSLTNVNGTLFFAASSSATTSGLWKSNGTSAGTVMVKSFAALPENLSTYKGVLYFSADNGVHGRELWRSDGSSAGTRMVQDTRPGPYGSNPGPVDPVGGLFRAEDGLLGSELWRTNGTAEGTFFVANASRSSVPAAPKFVDFNGHIYFYANHGTQRVGLWRAKADGTDPELLRELNGWSDAVARPNFELGATSDYLLYTDYLLTNDTLYGAREYLPLYMWRPDDGVSTSSLVRPRYSTTNYNQNAMDITAVGKSIYFSSTTYYSSFRDLWLLTPDGSIEVSGTYGEPRYLSAANDSLYFASGTTGGLWRVLDQAAIKIADVTPVGYGTEFNGEYYFPGWTNEHGIELWRTDVATGGAVIVKEYSIGKLGWDLHSPVNVNGTLFFVGKTFIPDSGNTLALWKSDGTVEGTAVVRDLTSVEHLATYSDLAEFQGLLYFAADDGIHGKELWRSDGTSEGTVLAFDLWPGPDGGGPGNLFVSHGSLYFSANDGQHGNVPFIYSPPLSADAGGPYFADEGQTITLDASGSSPEATLFEWDLDGDGAYETFGQSVSYFAEDSGVHTAALRVTGPTGTAFDTTTIEVENLPPIARVGGVMAGFTDLPSNLRLFADDPSPVDQAAGFDFEVDFDGDGTVDDVLHGSSGLLVSHTFAASDVYQVLVTAVDKDGGRSNTASHRVVIIDAVREADAEQPALTNLVWTGTDGDDHVVFTQTSTTTVLIELHQLNGVPLSPSFRAYMFGINGRVIANGLAGNDLIDLDGVTTISAEIYGGDGQDTIFGTQAADVIYANGPANTGGDGAEGDGGEGRPGSHVYGGGGDDVLFGARGRDYLDAGTGRNLIHAGRDGAEGRDTLIGASAPDVSPQSDAVPLTATATNAVVDELTTLDEVLANWKDDATSPIWPT